MTYIAYEWDFSIKQSQNVHQNLIPKGSFKGSYFVRTVFFIWLSQVNLQKRTNFLIHSQIILGSAEGHTIHIESTEPTLIHIYTNLSGQPVLPLIQSVAKMVIFSRQTISRLHSFEISPRYKSL